MQDFNDTGLIFTISNAYTYGRVVLEKITSFCQPNDNAKAFASLGQLRYLSCVNQVDAVIGNSSSGIMEVPSFKKPTINIGVRQKGRLKAASVIGCSPASSSIRSAIEQLNTIAFQAELLVVENPYGEGGASQKRVSILQECSFTELLKKSFFDIAFYK